jgi:hypothetical protein
MDELKLFIPITKVDEEKRLVFGRVTEETPDSSGEIFDYQTSKPFFEDWIGYFQKATDGKSSGNLRAMHDAKKAIGSLPEVHLLDKDKAVEVVAKVVDDDEWGKCKEGVYTGFSQGGKYVKKWYDGKYHRYTAQPNEISLVDYPMLKTATFSLVKADGIVEQLSFKAQVESPLQEALKKENISSKEVTDLLFKYVPLQDIDVRWTREEALEVLKKVGERKTSDPKNGGPPPTKESQKMKKIESVEEAQGALKKYAGEEIADVASAVYALQSIAYLYAKEKAAEHPEPPEQILALKACIENLKSFIASEIMEADANDVMRLSERVGKLIKADTPEKDIEPLVKVFDSVGYDLKKRGATISATNLTKIQAMHDHTVDLGAKCNKAASEPAGDMAKVVKEKEEALKGAQDELKKYETKFSEINKQLEELKKAEAEKTASEKEAALKKAEEQAKEIELLKKSAQEKDETIKKVTALAAENEVLKAKEKERDEALQKIQVLTTEKDALAKELTEIKNTPEPPKGATKAVTVTKADDTKNPEEPPKEEKPQDPMEAIKKSHTEPRMWAVRKIAAKVTN